MSEMTLIVEEKRSLANEDDAAGLEYVGEQELFMDSHGCNVVLVAVRENDRPESQLLGFTFRRSSEEWFYDDDPMELVPIVAEELKVIQYTPMDGRNWFEI